MDGERSWPCRRITAIHCHYADGQPAICHNWRRTEKCNMKFLTKENPWRTPHLAGLAFIAVGYLLYFSTLWLPTPAWAREFIEELTPTLKSLLSAARVAAVRGEDAFPAQVMILYGVCGFVVMSLIFCLSIYIPTVQRNLHFMDMIQRNTEKLHISRLKMFFYSIFNIIASIIYNAFWFADLTRHSIGWRAHNIYSANFFSVTLFDILTPLGFALSILASTSMFCLSVKKSFNSINLWENS
jgi:hypothetical protein